MIKIVISRRETLILAQVGLHWVACTVLYILDTLDLERNFGRNPLLPIRKWGQHIFEFSFVTKIYLLITKEGFNSHFEFCR